MSSNLLKSSFVVLNQHPTDTVKQQVQQIKDTHSDKMKNILVQADTIVKNLSHLENISSEEGRE